MSARIAVVLPAREAFTRQRSGAVALCARDFSIHSRFRERIVIVGAGPCEYEDVRYLRLLHWRRWWRRPRTAYALAIARAARDHGFAALEIQNRPYMCASLRRRLPGVKLALYLLNDPQEMAGSQTAAERRRLIETVDAIWCVSQWVRERFLEGVADREVRASVIYPGIAAHPPLEAKEKIIAFVGRVVAIKGVAELARAFALASDRLQGWRLVVAGADPDGLLAPWRASLGDRLEIMGQVSHAEAMELFRRAEIAAVPSVWKEPFGRTAIEALASGCALITSGRGGLAEICEGVAEIVDPENAEAFAAALSKLGGDEARRAELQGRGQARARAQFEIGAAAARLDSAREQMLAL